MTKYRRNLMSEDWGKVVGGAIGLAIVVGIWVVWIVAIVRLVKWAWSL